MASVLGGNEDFAAKGLEFLAKKGAGLEKKVYAVPAEIDRAVASIKLQSEKICIDTLSKEQEEYLQKVE